LDRAVEAAQVVLLQMVRQAHLDKATQAVQIMAVLLMAQEVVGGQVL
jgi:hypothetical protein